MPKATKIYGWKNKDGKICLSLRKQSEKWSFNIYDSPNEALTESSRRGLPIEWEDVADIDSHGRQ